MEDGEKEQGKAGAKVKTFETFINTLFTYFILEIIRLISNLKFI